MVRANGPGGPNTWPPDPGPLHYPLQGVAPCLREVEPLTISAEGGLCGMDVDGLLDCLSNYLGPLRESQSYPWQCYGQPYGYERGGQGGHLNLCHTTSAQMIGVLTSLRSGATPDDI